MAAYRDPYAGQYGQSRYPHSGENVPEFNPYIGSSHQPYQTYEPVGPGHDPDADTYVGGYQDEPQHRAFPATMPSMDDLPVTVKESNTIERDDAFVPPRREKTARALRQYRYDSQGALWTKGSRASCVGRFCCCTILITLFLIISIVLSLALWIRPPNVIIGDASSPTTGSTIQVTSDGIDINLTVNITVANPNYFSVILSQITADIFYPINNTAVGGGTASGLDFHSHSNETFTFPFTISYQTTLDPGYAILEDLATKCGVIGSQSSNIVVNYKILLAIKIVFVTVKPVISNSLSFACPLTESDLEGLLKDAGISL